MGWGESSIPPCSAPWPASIEAPQISLLSRAIIEEAPKLHADNIAACAEGYRCVEAQLQRVAA
jgi:hypothetical protein